MISEKINANRFRIKTDQPHVEVCWQVTGVRNDAVARACPVNVETVKDNDERGLYQNPEVYGISPEKAVDYKRNKIPNQQQQAK